MDDSLWRRSRSKEEAFVSKGDSQLSVLGQPAHPAKALQSYPPMLPARDRSLEGFAQGHPPDQATELEQYAQVGEAAAEKVNLHSKESRRLQGDGSSEGTCQSDFCFLASSELSRMSGVHTVLAERSESIQLSDNVRQFLPSAQLSFHLGSGLVLKQGRLLATYVF